MAGGFTGRVLEIDLTGHRQFVSDTDMKAAELYLGGRGMGIKTLWDKIPSAGLDSLSPNNPLIFWPGPLSGLPLAGASRVSVVTKAANTSPAQSSSPNASTLTYSSLGGHFGPALKKAGYDGLIVSGRSDRPVVLIIDEEKISFRDASDLWGQSTSNTLDRLGRELGPDFRLLAIVTAGKNGFHFAGIISYFSCTTDR
jgi:aldehyde:ferredoxin oxidoreductase